MRIDDARGRIMRCHFIVMLYSEDSTLRDFATTGNYILLHVLKPWDMHSFKWLTIDSYYRHRMKQRG
jgi:hypothetical protein